MHYRAENYFRFELPRLLKGVDRCIYLDGDLVVLGDVQDLFDSDLGGLPIGAIEEPYGYLNNCERLGIPPENSYFNSGVLVLDLDEWRQADISKALFAWANEHVDLIKYVDQDVFNGLLNGNWKPLDLKWNVTYLLKDSAEPRFKFYDKVAIDNAKEKPALVHFAGYKTKPWNYMDVNSLGKLYWSYLELTPWKGYVPLDKTIANVIKKRLDPLVSIVKGSFRMVLKAVKRAVAGNLWR